MTKEKTKSKPTSTELLALASSQVTGEDPAPICFAFRSEPAGAKDSGWNFWSGEEDQEFLDEAENFELYPVSVFLEADESLAEIIDSEPGSSWERQDSDSAWVEMEEVDENEEE